jgi:hypothetical protein
MDAAQLTSGHLRHNNSPLLVPLASATSIGASVQSAVRVNKNETPGMKV